MLPEHLPRVEVEIVPPEVQQAGLDTYKRIGQEDHPETPLFRLHLQLCVADQNQMRSPTAERCASLVEATAV